MQEKKNYYGIYINNKVPKIKNEDNQYNKYYRSIKIKFEGKAFILKDHNEQEEIKSPYNCKKEGKSTIKFINSKNEIYYINVKIKKLCLVWPFFIAFLIMLGTIIFFCKNNTDMKYKIDEVLNYDLELEGVKYIFDINYENENFQSIELTDKVTNKKIVYPGSYGSFYIIISTKNGNKDMNYLMQIQEETRKPSNLKFKVNNEIYNSIGELAKNINGTIPKASKEIIKIDWFWEYETKDDITDTEDGINIRNYRFLMRMIGNEKV